MTAVEAPQWPAPHPEHGVPFDKDMIAARFGWTKRSAVDVAILRTKQGKARVAFPDPDGHAVKPEVRPRKKYAPARKPEPYWWAATVEAYAAERGATLGAVRLTPNVAGTIRTRLAEGAEVRAVADEFGITPAAVRSVVVGASRPVRRAAR